MEPDYYNNANNVKFISYFTNVATQHSKVLLKNANIGTKIIYKAVHI